MYITYFMSQGQEPTSNEVILLMMDVYRQALQVFQLTCLVLIVFSLLFDTITCNLEFIMH